MDLIDSTAAETGLLPEESQVRAAARTVPARLLEYAPGEWIALPVHATLEVLDEPRVVDVPGAPAHCRRLVRWQGRWLPVLELSALVSATGADEGMHPAGRGSSPEGARLRHLLVVAWPQGSGFDHGALALPAMPATVAVSDAARCPLPVEGRGLWQRVALSCFEHEGRAVPIVDTGRLFAG